jgi:DNA ligase-1
MMHPWDRIKALEADNSKLFKEDFIRKAAEAGDSTFFKGLRYALDGFDTFGVKKIPVRTGADGPGLEMDVFEGLAELLIDRDVTGNAAGEMIDQLMNIATNDQWNNWYRRILMKKLDAGFSETTVNKACKAYPQYQIPVFSCMLAQDAKDKPEKLEGRKIIDGKFDGARVLTILKPNGVVVQVSRNGLLLENFPKIRQQFEAIKWTKEAIVIDGEMMSANFQALMKQFKRKTNVDTSDSIYHVFDILTLAEFQAGQSREGQLKRRMQLDAFWSEHADKLVNVETVGYEIVDLSTVDGKKRFNTLNEEAIEAGLEGLMIKDVNAPYETKRSWSWMKLKPRIVVTLPIKCAVQGDPDSKYADVLGALECEGTDVGNEDDTRYIEVSCGGGFSDDERKHLWNIRHQLPGILIDIEADAITKNQDGRYSLRFPRKKTFRGFVPGQKI